MAVTPKNVEILTIAGEPFSIIHLGAMQLAVTEVFYSVSKLLMDNLVHFHQHSDRDVFHVTRTADEVTIVCRASLVPAKLQSAASKILPGYRAFRIKGQVDLSVVGVLAHLSEVLAKAHVPIFVCSTYETDYFFVKAEQNGTALEQLRKAGHKIHEGKEPTTPAPFQDPHSNTQWICPKCPTNTRNPYTLELCGVCQTPRPQRRPSGAVPNTTDPKYSEFQKGDVDRPNPMLQRPDYFKLSPDAIDMATGKVKPEALEEARERARLRVQKHADKDKPPNPGGSTNSTNAIKARYLSLDNNSVEAAGRPASHSRQHSGSAPPHSPVNPASNYSTMQSTAMADFDGKPGSGGAVGANGKPRKDYVDMEVKDFKHGAGGAGSHQLHPSATAAASPGGHSHTPGRNRADSGAATEEFDQPRLHHDFARNYASSMSVQDFPDGTGPPIQRTNATIGGMMSAAGSGTGVGGTGGGGGGVDGPSGGGGGGAASLSRSESTDGGSYSTVAALEGGGGRWTPAEGKLDLDIEHKPYYRGEIGRSGAGRALESKPAGTFLFRLCSDKGEADMAGHVFVLNYINASDKRFSNVKIYRFQSAGPNGGTPGWCMHRDRKGTVYPNLDIIIRAINFGVPPTPLAAADAHHK